MKKKLLLLQRKRMNIAKKKKNPKHKKGIIKIIIPHSSHYRPQFYSLE